MLLPYDPAGRDTCAGMRVFVCLFAQRPSYAIDRQISIYPCMEGIDIFHTVVYYRAGLSDSMSLPYDPAGRGHVFVCSTSPLRRPWRVVTSRFIYLL